MITGEIKSKVDLIWDTLWSAVIANRLTVIELMALMLCLCGKQRVIDGIFTTLNSVQPKVAAARN